MWHMYKQSLMNGNSNINAQYVLGIVLLSSAMQDLKIEYI